jgi:hypothetical protein
VLRDDPLKSQLAGVLVDGRAVTIDVLVELDAWAGDLAQEMLEPPPLRRQSTNAARGRPGPMSGDNDLPAPSVPGAPVSGGEQRAPGVLPPGKKAP